MLCPRPIFDGAGKSETKNFFLVSFFESSLQAPASMVVEGSEHFPDPIAKEKCK